MRVHVVSDFAAMRLPLWAIEQPLPGRPPLPGTDLPLAPPALPGRPEPLDPAPRPTVPDTNIPEGTPAISPDMPDPGAMPPAEDVPRRPEGETDFPAVNPIPR